MKVRRCMSKNSEVEDELCRNELCISGERYCFHHTERGKALIFNHSIFEHLPSRHGSKHDRENIETSLRYLGFQVDIHVNLGIKELKDVLQSESERDQSDEDCFLCVFMTHGSEGEVHCQDGPIKISEILEYFSFRNCPSLGGKPKLFIFNACRGEKLDPGIDVVDSINISSPTPISLYLEEDFLLACSVVSGYASARDFRKGSCFIAALSETISKYGLSVDLIKLMTRVNSVIATTFERKGGTKQMPCVYTMLTKDIYFS